MCVLINSFLIPKIERGTTPVNLTADRIYDLNQNQCKIDPLLFVPISDYLRDSGDNFIFDFSADANVCILPLQFMLGPNTRSSDDADPLFIENSLGYKPQIDIFPYDYVRDLYNKVDKEMLYDDISVPVGSTGLVLNDTDKARRI